MRRYLVIFLLICTAGVFAQEIVNNEAPDFVLPDLKGNNYKLSENLNQGPILINFWATWCIPCREEMKKLKDVYEEFEGDGLQILAISIDDPKSVSRVRSFINTRKYPFKVLLDTNSEVMQLFQAENPPYTALLNSEGIIYYTHSGYRKGDEKILEDKIAMLVKTQNPDDKSENKDE
jgi:cytochrome c biogenesis protein CcmG/thiol:disulfide interchange protein DsbE